MNILNANSLSKSYGEKTLFSDISFSINEGEKIGIIGINGTGKSTLLKILANVDNPDSGNIVLKSNTTIEFLSQNPDFDPDATVIEQIFKSEAPAIKLIKDYESTTDLLIENPDDKNLQTKITDLTDKINATNGWELENLVKTILTKLGITNFNSKMKFLSGGQQKRVALAETLITPCDILILDEPTNHMDNDTIDWLESHLKSRKGALVMVTHDRYFLDRVANKTFELENGSLYSYPGNYSYFLEKRMERRSMENSLERKRKNLYKRELEWIRAGCPARSTKQKSRIQRFETLENKIENSSTSAYELDISLAQSRLGKKTIELNKISKSFGTNNVINDFSYTFLRDDRVGIIGKNGAGKSTLLNIITNRLPLDKGTIDIGETVKIGYFSQNSDNMDDSLKAIEYIKESAEFVRTSDGSKISASQMMERFLFNSEMQWSYIKTLSGGEKRRLFLLKILMEEPNVLILDEPTNDLDIDSLSVLETYIEDFNGIVISVSHDRYFLDRICDRIFSYEENGIILEHTGNYSDYKKFKETYLEDLSMSSKNKSPASGDTRRPRENRLKFTFKEKQEFESIEFEIEELEMKLENIIKDMETYPNDFEKLNILLKEKNLIEENLLCKMERLEYLEDLNDKILNQK